MKIKTINYILIMMAIITRIIDIVFTAIILRNPMFYESNPLGFTPLHITIGFIIIILIFIFNYKIKNRILLYALPGPLIIVLIRVMPVLLYQINIVF